MLPCCDSKVNTNIIKNTDMSTIKNSISVFNPNFKGF